MRGIESADARLLLDHLIDAITLIPEGDVLRIELRGDLAAMLGATVQSKRSPETGDLSLQAVMVAGATLLGASMDNRESTTGESAENDGTGDVDDA